MGTVEMRRQFGGGVIVKVADHLFIGQRRRQRLDHPDRDALARRGLERVPVLVVRVLEPRADSVADLQRGGRVACVVELEDVGVVQHGERRDGCRLAAGDE